MRRSSGGAGGYNTLSVHRFVGLESFCIGSVRDGLDSERVDQIYRSYHAVRRERCRTCWARYVCGGPCPWQLADEQTGCFREPEHDRCGLVKHGLENSFRLLMELLDREPEFCRRHLGIRQPPRPSEPADSHSGAREEGASS
jgi:radical SAM protein with 4Fe4S-binding SPASM domain